VTIPTFRSRAAALLLVAGSVLVACGDDDTGDDSSTPSQETTTTVPTLGIEELRAAVSALTELPEGYSISQQCLQDGEPECNPNAVEAWIAAEDGEGSSLVISAEALDDADAATTRLENLRGDDQEYDGTFDVPAEAESTTNGGSTGAYVAGEQGEGTVEDVEVDGWSGYEVVKAYEAFHPDGSSLGHATEGRFVAVRGNAFVEIVVRLEDPEATTDDIADQVDDLAQALLDELG
jgi:hypothetical protein